MLKLLNSKFYYNVDIKNILNLRLKEKTNQLKTIMFKNLLVYVHINLLVTNLISTLFFRCDDLHSAHIWLQNFWDIYTSVTI